MKIEYIEPPSNDIPMRYHDLTPMRVFYWDKPTECWLYVKLAEDAYVCLEEDQWRYRFVTEGCNPEVIVVGTLVGVTIEKD